MPYQGDIRRGVWAGYKFLIATSDRLDSEGGEETWKDVTKEAKEELYKIWESKYQETWQGWLNGQALDESEREDERGYGIEE